MSSSSEAGLSTDALKTVLGEQVARYFFPLEVNNPLSEEENSLLEQELLKLAGFENMRDFLETVAPKTVIVTFIAGAGSRWVKSLQENPDLIQQYGIVEGYPRALANVKVGEEEQVPIAVYNLLAVSGLGTQIIVYGGSTDEEAENNRKLIEQEIVERVKNKISGFMEPVFIRQRIHPGQQKPLGHGDALLQIIKSDEGREALEGKRYIITNFGGDPNSYRTAVLSLLAMYVLDNNNLNIGVLIPTAIASDTPPYGIFIDGNGLPAGVSHKKENIKSSKETEPTNQTNVGMRFYLLDPLTQTAQPYEDLYDQIARGNSTVSYPNGELKLDHFDGDMMRKRQALTFLIAGRDEIEAVKTVDCIPSFEKAMREILKRDGIFRGRHNLS